MNLKNVKNYSLTVVVLTFLFLLIPQSSFSQETLSIAKLIARSLNSVDDPKYKTVAFSRIRGNVNAVSAHEIIDYTNVNIVSARKFKVIDRSKLEEIIKEQKKNNDDIISSEDYRELGKLLGVDLFIYGRFYEDVLILKGIDVETSHIVWGDKFYLTRKDYEQDAEYQYLTASVINSLRRSLDILKSENIRNISFWSIQGDINPSKLTDYLSVDISNEKNFKVIDRENLELLLKEQILSQESIIDESAAKRIGGIYGIDGFIYGTIRGDSSKGKIASLKMMNITTGVIEWGEIIKLKGTSRNNTSNVTGNSAPEGMIEISGGTTLIGRNDWNSSHSPEFKVNVSGFYLDQFEVSNNDYAEFVRRRGHRAPKNWRSSRPPSAIANHPVVYITWDDANKYCRSLNKRLPTEIEWEYAYRGSKGNILPWGSERHRSNWTNTLENGIRNSQPVKTKNYDVSDFKIHHMAGNVREWTYSTYKPYANSNYSDYMYGISKVIRGGSWAKKIESSYGFIRYSSKQILAWPDVGFRCAKDN